MVLVLAIVAAYWNSLHGQFLFDDFSCIVDNPRIRHLWPLTRIVASAPDIAVAGRPLVSLSLAFNYALGGPRVLGYHLVNLALHLLVALGLFGIARDTLRSQRLRRHYGPYATGLALAIALVWATHPLLTESVTYVIQRTELLMAACLVATLACAIRSARSPSPHRWWLAAVAASACGMASKEVMVVAPLVVALYDRVFLAGSWRDVWRRRGWLYAGLASTWLVLAALVLRANRPATAGLGFAEATPWRYALTQAGVVARYLRLVVWPTPLVADYGDWPLAAGFADVWRPALVIGALLAATVWALRRWPSLGFLGAWFFLILAPTSSVLPIITELAAERRMYLPLLAPVALLIVGGWELLGRLCPSPHRSRLGGMLLAAATVALIAATIRRNADYASEVGMLRDIIAKRPGNVRAHYNLGIALAEQGRLDDSARVFATALRLKPDYASAHSNLGVVLAKQGHLPEAAAHYIEAIRLRPELPEPHNNLGSILIAQGRLEEATEQFEEALRLKPDFEEARQNAELARRWRRGDGQPVPSR